MSSVGLRDILPHIATGMSAAMKLPREETTTAAALSYAHTGGYVENDYLPEMRGQQGRRNIRAMSDNATIGGLLVCLHNLFRTTEWHVDPASDVSDPDKAADLAGWAYRVMTEMGDSTNPLGGSWDAFLYYMASALENGWAYVNVAKMLRPDGTIGVGEIVHVHPDTLSHWSQVNEKRVDGLYQYPPDTGGNVFVPLESSILFTPEPFKGSPEGRSILRPAYGDWFYYKRLVSFRAIMAERMCGFPVVTANSDLKGIANNTSLPEPDRKQAAAAIKEIEKIGPNIKVGKQGSVTLWTKPYQEVDADGNLRYSSHMQLKLELLTPQGGALIDYDAAIRSHEMNIAKSVLASWIMMGGEGTSGAQNGIGSQYDAFVRAAKSNMNALAICLTRQLIPMLWRWNGLDPEYMPSVRAGRIDTTTVEALGRYVESLTRAGVVVTDPETEEHLRREAGLPIPDTLSDGLR